MLIDQATLVVDTGNFFIAPEGTPAPADPRTPGPAWKNIGHTSLDNILKFASDGGDSKSLGTLQKKQLRTSYSTRSEKMTFVLQQFDEDSMRLYFGANMSRIATDSPFMGVPMTPVATRCAMLIVFLDQATNMSFYIPSCEVMRAADLEIADTESLVGMPLNITPLVWSTNTWTYAITPKAFNGTATGATAGSPGAFTPAGSVAPFNTEEANAEITGLTTAWTTGQFVVLGSGQEAHWSGPTTKWQLGRKA